MSNFYEGVLYSSLLMKVGDGNEKRKYSFSNYNYAHLDYLQVDTIKISANQIILV